MSTNGILNTNKESLKKWRPKEALKDLEETMMGFFDENQSRA
jgi:hypothetical protein